MGPIVGGDVPEYGGGAVAGMGRRCWVGECGVAGPSQTAGARLGLGGDGAGWTGLVGRVAGGVATVGGWADAALAGLGRDGAAPAGSAGVVVLVAGSAGVVVLVAGSAVDSGREPTAGEGGAWSGGSVRDGPRSRNMGGWSLPAGACPCPAVPVPPAPAPAPGSVGLAVDEGEPAPPPAGERFTSWGGGTTGVATTGAAAAPAAPAVNTIEPAADRPAVQVTANRAPGRRQRDS